eukprot:361781-Chlamydomonas_euryale.AAC.2
MRHLPLLSSLCPYVFPPPHRRLSWRACMLAMRAGSPWLSSWHEWRPAGDGGGGEALAQVEPASLHSQPCLLAGY